MLSGTRRKSLQEQVIYGRPALEALISKATKSGHRRRSATAGRSGVIFASFLALVELRQVAGDDGAVHRPGITTAHE